LLFTLIEAFTGIPFISNRFSFALITIGSIIFSIIAHNILGKELQKRRNHDENN
jgi:hypothetical protein